MNSNKKSPSILEINGLTVKMAGFTLVDQVTFNIREREKFIIVGPNGAGKSTIIKAISQSIPYSGEILYKGEDVAKMQKNQIARNIGVLAQHHSVNYSFTVEEIVELGRFSYRKDKLMIKEEKEIIQEALEMTGMIEKRKQSVLTLSGGEIQRTFLAQLFAQNPNILILDEPTNYLDIQYQEQMFRVIEEWITSKNKAVLAVVHDLSLASYFGSEFLLMNQGKAVSRGRKEEVMIPEQLNLVYEMNVGSWLHYLYKHWEKYL
ncbi:ABC transporter ATP-binding protein [Anaerosacchariphilus polymeriproducens]|uniref:ABC transporter ATP-binding protein n=1 Tax=Anaerosacchariphilus polymeriproducens TaxID=1812858 RepID=A0A371AXG7_9FIRM|nr:ABC transporter ATP-binding protein [Anaerosacchariphilus polymeriproducens]RDU24276.1 ABC transporter ATP-binding protein [Anaerosacchariphilus polymeriproducens]